MLFRAEVGHLKLNLAKLGDNVMKTVAKDGIGFLLIELEIKFLEKFIFSLN